LCKPIFKEDQWRGLKGLPLSENPNITFWKILKKYLRVINIFKGENFNSLFSSFCDAT